MIAKKTKFLPSPTHARLGTYDNAITSALIWWMVFGAYVDGWAHNNLPSSLESFFTPWHGVLYSGFFAVALWINFLLWRNYRANPTAELQALIPSGYEYGFVGIFLFGLGGLGDMVWHTFLGIEANVEALLSPPHLLLLVGALLIQAAPLRSAWLERDMQKPNWSMFAPAFFSFLAVVATISFFQQYLWAFVRVSHATQESASFASLLNDSTGLTGRFMLERANLAAMLVTNVVLVASGLLLAKRFALPFGTFVLFFGINTAMMVAMQGLAKHPEQIAGALLAGLGVDALYAWLQPQPHRVWSWRAFAFLMPLLLWSTHFVATGLQWGTTFSLQIFSGITLMCALAGFGLALLMEPNQNTNA